MRRAEKEVKDLEQLEEILRDCNTVRIGTQDAEGMFIVPVNYGYDLTEGQLTLYLHSAREGRKAAAFRRGGAVAFEMDCGHQRSRRAVTAVPTAASWAAGPSGS